jgi:hypothetical protein
MKGVPNIDPSVFTNGRKHYVCKPHLDNTEVLDLGATVLYRAGKALDLQELEKDPDYLKHLRQNQQATNALSKFRSATNAGIDELKALAKHGYFESVCRHTEHFRILSRAQWTTQNGEDVISAILEGGKGNGTILGNKANKSTLESQLRDINRNHRERLLRTFPEDKQIEILPDPKNHDLTDADFPELDKVLRANLKSNTKTHLAVKSPHGSGKTTAIVPRITRLFKEVLGREPRILYICTLRSIIRGTSKQLGFECYLTEGDEVCERTITSADKLGICIKSIQRIRDQTKSFDVIIRDESEQIALWSQWNSGGDTLRDYSFLNELATHKDVKINLLMDADLGPLSYWMLRKNIENDKAYLLENTHSWICHQEQTLSFHQKEYGVVEQLYLDGVEQEKFCFVHVDYDDKDSNPKLTALTKALNDLAGKEIAKSFWRGTGRETKKRLFEDADNYLAELHSQGIRIIIVSPIIVSGWRYKGVIDFDATYGIYGNNIQSAPAIIQRTQRVIKCRDHHIYVNPISRWTDLQSLREDYEKEHGLGWFPKGAYRDKHEDAAKELMTRAGAEKARLFDNVKLHLIHLWSEFGGQQEHLKQGGGENEIEILSEAINDAKHTEIRKRAEMTFQDPEELKKLVGEFLQWTGTRWLDHPQPTNVDEVIDLQKKLDSLKNLPTSQEVIKTLSHSEEDWKRWDKFGPDWEANPEVLESYHKQDLPKPSFYLLGQVLNEIERALPVNSFLEWLTGAAGSKLVIQTSEIDKKQFDRIVQNHRAFLRERFPAIFANGATKFEKVLSNILRKVLHLEVKCETPEEVVAAKNQLLESYLKSGHLSKNSRSKKELQRDAENLLVERMKLNYELSWAERNYRDKAGKIIEVTIPKVLPVRLRRFIEAGDVRRAGWGLGDYEDRSYICGRG